MALSAGSVTVADDGTRTGSGLALAFYDQFMDGITAPVDEIQLTARRACAAQCTKMAAAIVGHFVANAVVSLSGCNAHVTNESLGVAGGVPIDPPASPVDVPITGTGTLS